MKTPPLHSWDVTPKEAVALQRQLAVQVDSRRTRDKVKPLFVSVGHKIDQASAVRLVLLSGQGYRIPEPTRQAHMYVNALRRRLS